MATDPLSLEERRLKVAIMTDSGVSERDIARTLTVSRSTVRRDLDFARKNDLFGTGNGLGMEGGKLVYMPSSKRSRVSRDGQDGTFFSKVFTVVEPDDHETDWRILELDRETLNKVRPTELIEMLANTSPALSRAISDYIRLCDAGHHVDVFKPGTTEVHQEAKAKLKEYHGKLEDRYGSMKTITNRLHMSGYVRGAMLAEVVLNRRREAVDLVVVDPYVVRWKLVDDPELGQRWQLGQWQEQKWVSLEIPTVRYQAHDAWPGKPYGRSPAMPGLFPCLFLIGLMHDLRRVVAQQGYPRIDIALDLAKLAAAFPLVFKHGGDKWEELIDQSLSTVQSVYEALEPEDAFVHTDDTTVNRPKGALDSQAIQASDALIKALERMAVQALKTMPLMFGITDGVSEANANRQWEIQVAAVKSLQHMTETIMSHLDKVALEAMGFVADVKWTFHELRASELQRDEQTATIRSQNAAFMRDQGWLTELESARYGLDKDPSVDVAKALEDRPLKEPTAPVQPPGSAAEPPPATVDPDPGETKGEGDKVKFRVGRKIYVLDRSMIEEPGDEEEDDVLAATGD